MNITAFCYVNIIHLFFSFYPGCTFSLSATSTSGGFFLLIFIFTIYLEIFISNSLAIQKYHDTIISFPASQCFGLSHVQWRTTWNLCKMVWLGLNIRQQCLTSRSPSCTGSLGDFGRRRGWWCYGLEHLTFPSQLLAGESRSVQSVHLSQGQEVLSSRTDAS